jgi:curved DNA-binding protein CbpA
MGRRIESREINVPVKTLYTVLGVAPTADARDIEEAFIRLKLKFPEKKLASDENARNQFAAIQQAYATLGDPDARSVYDRRLETAGIRTATTVSADGAEASSWLSTRNIVVAGVIVLIAAAMWFYRDQERTRVQKEIIERALKLEEEQRRHQAELELQEEARRQARFDSQERRQDENTQRQFQNQSQRSAQQSSSQIQRAQQETEAVRRREQYDKERQAQRDDGSRRQAEYEAKRRVEEEKRLLREICMGRYKRPDC